MQLALEVLYSFNVDYLSITTFAKKGYASTAVAGVFSGQLMNFLLGMGISNVLNSIDGEY